MFNSYEATWINGMSQTPEAKPVILIVDDTPVNLGVLFESLSDSGFEVLTIPVDFDAPLPDDLLAAFEGR